MSNIGRCCSRSQRRPRTPIAWSDCYGAPLAPPRRGRRRTQCGDRAASGVVARAVSPYRPMVMEISDLSTIRLRSRSLAPCYAASCRSGTSFQVWNRRGRPWHSTARKRNRRTEQGAAPGRRRPSGRATAAAASTINATSVPFTVQHFRQRGCHAGFALPVPLNDAAQPLLLIRLCCGAAATIAEDTADSSTYDLDSAGSGTRGQSTKAHRMHATMAPAHRRCRTRSASSSSW